MGTTSKGYPYPESTDPVRDGATAIQALAETIDMRLPYGVAAGQVKLTGIGANATKSTTITLPAGRFDNPPITTASAVTASPNARPTSAGGSSVTAIQVYGTNASSVTADMTINWHAIAPEADALLAPFSLRATAEPTTITTVTCPTEGCANQGVPIPITQWPDPETGEPVPIDSVFCGVCGTDITDTLTEEPVDGS